MYHGVVCSLILPLFTNRSTYCHAQYPYVSRSLMTFGQEKSLSTSPGINDAYDSLFSMFLDNLYSQRDLSRMNSLIPIDLT